MQINYWAILVAAVANFIIGFMLHGPLFGKLWMKLANVTPTGNEKFKDMIPQMIQNLIANLVFAFVLGSMIVWNGLDTASRGMIFSAFVWLGFIVTTSSMDVIWMKRSVKLWMFENVASLVSILAMGAILATW